VKNQFVSILAEVEALEQIHQDEASVYHLENISNISHTTLERINALHRKFNNIKLDFKPVCLSVLVNEAVSKIAKVPDNIILFKAIDNQHYYALVDEGHMVEVIINILNNAIEATEFKKNGRVEISVEAEEHWCVISVIDTGCGIASSELRNIFHPFYSTKSSVKNWGVGLSYCHQIVTAHDGEIHVSPNKPQGTTFKILLPRIRKEDES
jgi:signal transduction histidine kinase